MTRTKVLVDLLAESHTRVKSEDYANILSWQAMKGNQNDDLCQFISVAASLEQKYLLKALLYDIKTSRLIYLMYRCHVCRRCHRTLSFGAAYSIHLSVAVIVVVCCLLSRPGYTQAATCDRLSFEHVELQSTHSKHLVSSASCCFLVFGATNDKLFRKPEDSEEVYVVTIC